MVPRDSRIEIRKRQILAIVALAIAGALGIGRAYLLGGWSQSTLITIVAAIPILSALYLAYTARLKRRLG